MRSNQCSLRSTKWDPKNASEISLFPLFTSLFYMRSLFFIPNFPYGNLVYFFLSVIPVLMAWGLLMI